MKYEKEIQHIMNDSSHRLNIRFIKNNYQSMYEAFNHFISDNSFLQPFIFKEQFYYFMFNITEPIVCKGVGCNKKTTINNNIRKGFRDFCSSTCANKSDIQKNKYKATCRERFGVDNASKSQIVKDKQEATNLLRWGTKSTAQNIEVKQKQQETIKNKYGVDHYYQSDDFKKKSEDTQNKKYGKHYTQTPEYKEKSIITNNIKYGADWHTQTPEYIIKTNKTNLTKYNNIWYLGSNAYKAKMTPEKKQEKKKNEKETNRSLFGTDNYKQSDLFKDGIIKSNIVKFRKIGLEYMGHEQDIFQFKGQCSHVFNIHRATLKQRIRFKIEPCTVCNPLDSTQSGQEKVLVLWLESLGLTPTTNTKKIITPFELDIYFQEHNLALEYNGLYWHNDSDAKNKTKAKNRYYHLNKTEMCNKKGIDLIHIWEDDWLNKQDIIKSIILNRVGLTVTKIYGRKCKIVAMTNKKNVNSFMDTNHIQGRTNYTTALGLMYNDEIVSIMLFGKVRSGHGMSLLRFCNKIYTNVIGAASKLFKYFVTNYEFEFITTFADIAMFNGSLYTTLDFKYIHRTPPNYYWVVDGIRYHRFNYSKSKLVARGYDENLSESQIMRGLGYTKIYGCGLDKYVYTK